MLFFLAYVKDDVFICSHLFLKYFSVGTYLVYTFQKKNQRFLVVTNFRLSGRGAKKAELGLEFPWVYDSIGGGEGIISFSTHTFIFDSAFSVGSLLLSAASSSPEWTAVGRKETRGNASDTTVGKGK